MMNIFYDSIIYFYLLSKIGLPNYITARKIALKASGSLPTTFDALNSTTSPEVYHFVWLIWKFYDTFYDTKLNLVTLRLDNNILQKSLPLGRRYWFIHRWSNRETIIRISCGTNIFLYYSETVWESEAKWSFLLYRLDTIGFFHIK